ncbi:hypothetical protein Tco_0236814 [Tanacetum coccineum]
MPEDSRVPIILGRPFLATARAMIDVFNKKITLMKKFRKLLANEEPDSFLSRGLEKSIDQSDLEGCEPVECKTNNDSDSDEPIWRITSINTPYLVMQEIAKPVDVEREHLYAASANEIDEKKPELKDLPHHLEYAYLHGDKSFPIIISSELSEKEKISLLQDAKPRLIRWVLLLQGFDIEIKDKRGAENLAADHLSRLKNPDLGTFTKEEIADEFPDEQLMDNIMRRCVAGNEIFDILAHCNSGPTRGHHSASVTGRKVYEFVFFLPSIFKDAKDYVMRCDACQRSGNISSRSEMPHNNIQVCLQVLQKKDGIFLSQDKYMFDILKKFGLSYVRSMIGSLMYLIASRPDIMFVVCACARHQVIPKECHLHAVKRVFKYLKENLPLPQRLISWQCKKQTIMDTSTTEAEYVAAASGYGQVLWIQNQLLHYGYNFMNTKIYIDNNSAICIVKNPVYHSKTKHIEIRHHFIRDCYEKKLINVDHIHTDDNVADLLTKAFDVGRIAPPSAPHQKDTRDAIVVPENRSTTLRIKHGVATLAPEQAVLRHGQRGPTCLTSTLKPAAGGNILEQRKVPADCSSIIKSKSNRSSLQSLPKQDHSLLLDKQNISSLSSRSRKSGGAKFVTCGGARLYLD